ncbi:MAG TPA: hypothetical protein VFB32_12215 [Rudaea sp.]|nr:hypothetical protein [Rudaea sp.]
MRMPLLGCLGAVLVASAVSAQTASPQTDLVAAAQVVDPASNPTLDPAPQVGPAPANPPAADVQPPPILDAGTQPAQAAPAEPPPTVRSAHPLPADQVRAHPIFVALDRGHKGYLSEADASSNAWLELHFKECDLDHDGRLSEHETGACLAKAPAPERR